MNPIIIVGGLGLLAWVAFGKKSTPAATQATAIVKAPTATQPGSIDVGIPKTIGVDIPVVYGALPNLTPPTVVQVPDNVPLPTDYPPKVASNTSLALTYDEQVSIESDLPNDLYQKAMASNHQVYVAAAAAALALRGDTRAGDLTQRVANWGH